MEDSPTYPAPCPILDYWGPFWRLLVPVGAYGEFGGSPFEGAPVNPMIEGFEVSGFEVSSSEG